MQKFRSESKSRESRELQQELLLPRPPARHCEEDDYRHLFPEIVGNHPKLTQVLESIARIAKSTSSVLILGESGTGKELLAAALHRLSNRNSKSFVAINCSAIPEDLLEAELFGHEKGAFTGADRRRTGYLDLANGGTIFFDEVGDMPLRLQSKLLRVIQERTFSPLGSSEVKTTDLRIVAATNKDLEEEVQQKTFRLDLFYRLNVLPITAPALRTRTGDIPLLVRHFCDVHNRANPGATPVWFSEDAISAMENYTWPGNVRQLQNLVERLAVMNRGGEIKRECLPPELFQNLISPEKVELAKPAGDETSSTSHTSVLPQEGIDLNSYLQEIENGLILEALVRTKNNKNQAAKLLGLNRTTLVERLKKRNISI